MRVSLYVLLLLSAFGVFAQEKEKVEPLPPPMIQLDSLYREDQFYVGFTYNRLLNKPAGVSQNKFSAGFTGGFLRDMPINKARTWAIAAGLGLSYNKYFQNLVISKVDGEPQYNIITTGTQYEKNKYEQLLIDVPIELRWRTSTPQSHKFWRIYSGVKLSYVALGRSIYIDDTYNIEVSKNPDINRFQVGAFLAWGYNTWNFYGYYGLTSIFNKDARLNDGSVGLNPLHLGLMFYIL